ncbi:MAG TPA: glycoside hydrolase family 9 [Verrucomicrobia bacterium]|nr:glycoside hydrolase family 9 [Verrucomicrobiota bacterium]HOP96692.1 glycoside hydrolase family 9 protein [Verrucomicrobiota bacterium]
MRNALVRAVPSANDLSRRKANVGSPIARSLVILALSCSSVQTADAADAAPVSLKVSNIGDHSLNILSPTLLELVRINTKQPWPARVDSWDWVTDDGNFIPPNMSSIRVIVDGQTNAVTGIGFKRRPIFATLEFWNLRIANSLYLQLSQPIVEGQSVQVINDGAVWPTDMQFSAIADPLRFNPAIHVNQEGYLPAHPKKALVGHYLGSLGELPVHTNVFLLVDAGSGTTVHQGALTPRSDLGYTYTPAPYQNVREADFTSFTTAGQYRLVVPGMGASLPFRIDEGIGMAFSRTLALGMFHQRSGYEVAMPFTRFTHAADHTAPAVVPMNADAPFTFTWATASNYATVVNPDNPPQTAPRLTGPAAQLYPFVNPGPVDVSGGHFEAANYSKPTWNSAYVIHALMFAVDSLPGVASLDNLGIPESGDGISDILQEAKWEADFLAKMQDADGGFYYMVHPLQREYEFDVLPENGDPQVVWPKNTASTAAAVAALMQCASSPAFQQAYPAAANDYRARAFLGWQFLTNAIAAHGLDGAYQRIMHFDDFATHTDDLAWAACELFLATGDPQYQNLLLSWFPDPVDPDTARWGWWKMYGSYGSAVRSYTAAVRSGRLSAAQLDTAYLAKCNAALVDCANDNLLWSQNTAYGSSIPELTKAYRSGGWYYSAVQGFDLVAAYPVNPDPAYLDAVLRNLNYEAGCNPINVSYITGLGWKRQRIIVDQYSANDHRVLPKTGIPVSNLQSEFYDTWTYGTELKGLPFPPDYTPSAPYAYYDRWCDDWNVSTESSTTDTARALVVAAWLAAKTSLTNQAWRSVNAVIHAPAHPSLPNQAVTVTLQVPGMDLSDARIVWEARDQDPSFGGPEFTFTPSPQEGTHWMEAEAQWPDGRRAFAMSAIEVSADASPRLTAPGMNGADFAFTLSGTPNASYAIESSTDLSAWSMLQTTTLPASGVLEINHSGSGTGPRYYRARRVP